MYIVISLVINMSKDNINNLQMYASIMKIYKAPKRNFRALGHFYNFFEKKNEVCESFSDCSAELSKLGFGEELF